MKGNNAKPSQTCARATTTRHPAPSSCRKEEADALLANSNKEPKNKVETGSKATNAFTAVAFITQPSNRTDRLHRCGSLPFASSSALSSASEALTGTSGSTPVPSQFFFEIGF